MRQGDVFKTTVYEFFDKVKIPFDPDNITLADVDISSKLIAEEFDEAWEELENYRRAVVFDSPAEQKAAKIKLLKELGDLIYVIYYAAVKLDLPLMQAFNRIHASNLSKLGDDGKPIFREDGKLLKGPNYSPPDLSDLV